MTFYLFILSIRTGCMFDVASHAVVFRGHTSPKEGTLGVRHYCGLRWLYTISSVFAGSDIYIFLDVLILSTRRKYLGSNIVLSSSVLILC